MEARPFFFNKAPRSFSTPEVFDTFFLPFATKTTKVWLFVSFYSVLLIATLNIFDLRFYKINVPQKINMLQKTQFLEKLY